MNKKKYLTAVLLVLILGFNWQYVVYIYNSLTKDSRIEIIDFDDKEDIESYEELIPKNLIASKPSAILFNNGWTREKFLELDHSKIYANCQQKKWNLIYLSNEFGDTEYNRTRADWFNKICKLELSGNHIYSNDQFDLFEKYTLTERTSSGKTMQFPHVLLLNKQGLVTDTLYSFEHEKIREIIN